MKRAKQQVGAYALPEKYESAILGMTVYPGAKPQLAYSLRQLTNILIMRDSLSPKEAEEKVGELVTEFVSRLGKEAPTFIADIPDKPSTQITLDLDPA